jgi:WD40 repeat protein
LEEFKDAASNLRGSLLSKRGGDHDMMNIINIPNSPENMKDGITGENEGEVYEDIIKKQRKFRLLGHTDAIFCVSISSDKKYIISGSFDQTVRLWSVFTKQTLVVYKGHFAPVLSVKFSPFTYEYYIEII